MNFSKIKLTPILTLEDTLINQVDKQVAFRHIKIYKLTEHSICIIGGYYKDSMSKCSVFIADFDNMEL